jgi:uncharacterized membrane protein (DUF2068 family)
VTNNRGLGIVPGLLFLLETNMTDAFATAFMVAFYGAIAGLHFYGCWLIASTSWWLAGVVAFFMPPLPIFYAVLHMAGG